MTEYKWGEWEKVDLTLPFFLKGQDTWRTVKENQILMDIFSLELEGKNLEYFDSETDRVPRIPDELKMYCPTDDQNTEFWPTNMLTFFYDLVGVHPYDWDKWFHLNHSSSHHTIVSGYRNLRLGDGWYLVKFENLFPIIIRPIKEENNG